MQKSIISSLSGIVGNQNILTQNLEMYNVDWMRKYKGNSQLVITPENTNQISEVLGICNQNRIKVVPQSGNTGLVGGGVPTNNEVILSLKKMNKIIDFDENTSIITAEAGVILQDLNNYLNSFKYQMAWDLGARGSCLLGGNISTNSGGLNVVKHGLLRNYVLGLEVVLPNGKILNLLNKNRKDNTGTDLKQLFIGSEGTLGIITKANILCIPIPDQNFVFFVELKNYNQVLDVLKMAKPNEQLKAFEFMEGKILKKNMVRHTNYKLPFNFSDKKYYVLIELSGCQINVDKFSTELLQFSNEIVINKNEKEAQILWKIREEIAESMGKMGYVLKYDISIPPNKFEWFLNEIYPNRQGPYNVFYGHVGDGNVHINIVLDSLDALQNEEDRIQLKLFQLVKQLGGSISAEHGVGQHKRKYMELQKGIDVLEYMKKIKFAFDPNEILNPNKMF